MVEELYSSQLPLLATMAQKYLCIPATSVSSEWAVNTAGNNIIVNAKCSCLLPENTNLLTFLSQNLDQLQSLSGQKYILLLLL